MSEIIPQDLGALSDAELQKLAERINEKIQIIDSEILQLEHMRESVQQPPAATESTPERTSLFSDNDTDRDIEQTEQADEQDINRSTPRPKNIFKKLVALVAATAAAGTLSAAARSLNDDSAPWPPSGDPFPHLIDDSANQAPPSTQARAENIAATSIPTAEEPATTTATTQPPTTTAQPPSAESQSATTPTPQEVYAEAAETSGPATVEHFLNAVPPTIEQKNVFTGREVIQPTAIVLHWTGDWYDSVDEFIAGIQGNGAAVQIFIDKYGTVYQLTNPLNSYTGHAEGVNMKSIGIEIEGDSEDDLLNNQTQFESVVRTVHWLQGQFGIGNENDPNGVHGVMGHYEVDGVHAEGHGKVDPGENFMAKVRAELQRQADVQAQAVAEEQARAEETLRQATEARQAEILEFIKSHPVEDNSIAKIKEFIHWAAAQYGTNGDVLQKMAELESEFDVNSENNWDDNAQAGTPSAGLLHYIQPTFDAFAPQALQAHPELWAALDGNENFTDVDQVKLDRLNWQQQVLVTAWALKNGLGPEHWPTTWAKMGNPIL